MTVTQRLMAPGSFRVSLRPETPNELLRQIQLLDHLIILPGALSDATVAAPADVIAQAKSVGYTGVVTGKPSRLTFEGYDLSWWLGTPDGLGGLILDQSGSALNLTAWIDKVLPSNGITKGTITNVGGDWTAVLTGLVTPREAIDTICDVFDAEWRIRADGTLDAGGEGDLFETTPKVIVTRDAGGIEDDGIRGIEGGVLSVSMNADGITSGTLVVGEGQGVSITFGGAGPLTPDGVRWSTFAGGTPNMTRLINAPSMESTDLTKQAGKVLAQFNAVRKDVQVSSSTPSVFRFVKPGDSVWVYDADSGLIDSANQVRWRGQIIQPEKLRVSSLTWPVMQGMGVYARLSTSPVTVLDLSPWVQSESGETRWEVASLLGPRQMGTPAWRPWTKPSGRVNDWPDPMDRPPRLPGDFFDPQPKPLPSPPGGRR